MSTLDNHPDLLDRMERAVEKVRERLMAVARGFEAEGIDYAVAGGNAVAAWVATVDEAAVRNTQDVDVVVRADDLERIRAAMQKHGFRYRHVAGVDMLLRGDDDSPRNAVHLVFGGRRIQPDYPADAPGPEESETAPEGFRLLRLEALVRMKLTSFRRKDQVHLDDLIAVGLVDTGWLTKLEPALADRLRYLLENPE